MQPETRRRRTNLILIISDDAAYLPRQRTRLLTGSRVNGEALGVIVIVARRSWRGISLLFAAASWGCRLISDSHRASQQSSRPESKSRPSTSLTGLLSHRGWLRSPVRLVDGLDFDSSSSLWSEASWCRLFGGRGVAVFTRCRLIFGVRGVAVCTRLLVAGGGLRIMDGSSRAVEADSATTAAARGSACSASTAVSVC